MAHPSKYGQESHKRSIIMNYKKIRINVSFFLAEIYTDSQLFSGDVYACMNILSA